VLSLVPPVAFLVGAHYFNMPPEGRLRPVCILENREIRVRAGRSHGLL